MRCLPASLLLAVSVSQALLFAQADRATLSGTVTDPSNAPVSGAKVTLRQAATGFLRETETNSYGLYLMPGLPAGSLELSVRKSGFSDARLGSIVITVGQRATIDVRLTISAVETQVEVEAQSVELDKSSAEVAGVISGTELRNLPLNGRNWSSFMALAPGAVNTGEGNQNSINFFGRSLDDNNWTFDGVDASGVQDPRQTADIRLVMSLEAIAEYRVSSAMYTAESGNGAGAQINAVSKSGTNEFHGGLFEFFRNDKLDARRPIDEGKPPFRLNQFGANFGGPIVRDRLFFFGNYEGLRQRLGRTFIGFVPSEAFKARVNATSPALRPVMNAYTPGTSRTADPNIDQLVRVGSQPWREDSGFIRVDYTINNKTSIFGRYNIDEAVFDQINNVLLESRTFNIRTQNATIQLQRVWTPALLTETKIGFNRNAQNRLTNGTFGEGVTIPGFVALQTGRAQAVIGTTGSLIQTVAWTRNRHSFKFGGEIRPNALVYGDTNAVRTGFASREDVVFNRADSINIVGAVPRAKVERPHYSVFAQDDFKIRPNLTLNLGLRYEYYAVSKGRSARVLDFLRCGGFCPPGTPWFFPDRDNLAPRVALAWAPDFFGGKTVFRTGYGLFYGPGQLDDTMSFLEAAAENAALSRVEEPNLSFPAERFRQRALSQGASTRSTQRDREEGYSQQWTFSIQQQLPLAFVGQIAYVGSNGHHLFTRAFINTLDPVTRQRPFPNFSNIDEKQNNGNSSFHGLQTSLNRAWKNGFSWTTQYMWSKNINDNAGSGNGSTRMIGNCRRCERAVADWDVRHTFTAAGVYSVPFGPGHKWGPQSGFVSKLLKDWEISGSGTARTGRPFNVVLNRSANDIPDGAISTPSATAPQQRPNYVAGAPLYPANRTPASWLNFAAFSVPAPGTWGNLGRNAVRAPGMWQIDLAAGKRTSLTERTSLVFRAEFFNLFNRPMYGIPNANISQRAQFGLITSVINNQPIGSGSPRQVQLMVRLVF